MPDTADDHPEPLDARERHELCDLLLALGPDAPTMCEGWTTADLAAHLVIRERDPRSMPGIIGIGRFEAYTKKLQDRQKARGYEATVARIASGPPLIPWRLPKVRQLINLGEYYTHLEDVRRANGGTPRTDRSDLDDALWKLTKLGAKMAAGKLKPFGLELRRLDGTSHVVRKADSMVTITGEPGEITLFLNGRRSVANVEVSGSPEAIAAAHAARLGI